MIKLSCSGNFVGKTWRFPVDDVHGVFLEDFLSIHMSGKRMHHYALIQCHTTLVYEYRM